MYPPRGVNTPVPPSHAVVVDTCRIRFPKASVLAKAIHEHEEAAKRARDAEEFLRSVEADIHREGNEAGTAESERQDDAPSQTPSATGMLPDLDEDPQSDLTDAGDILILPDLENLISEAQEEVGAPKGGDKDEEAQDHGANDEEPQAELDWDEDEDLDGEYEEDDGGEYEEGNGGVYVEAEDSDVEVVNDTVIVRAKQKLNAAANVDADDDTTSVTLKKRNWRQVGACTGPASKKFRLYRSRSKYNMTRHQSLDDVYNVFESEAATIRWRDVFMPTYISFFGSKESPFTVVIGVVCAEFDNLLMKIFPEENRELSHQERGALYSVAYRQKAAWWRTLANNGLRNVIQYFISNGRRFRTAASRVEHAKDLLGGIVDRGDTVRFVWKEWDPSLEDSVDSVKGIFLNPLVTRTFAYFLERTDASVVDYGHPCGGLLLSVLAIERALCIYVDKKGGQKGLMGFSDAAMKTWMSHYQDGIRMLDDDQWQDIMEAAKAHDLSQAFVANPTTPGTQRKLRPLFEVRKSTQGAA